MPIFVKILPKLFKWSVVKINSRECLIGPMSILQNPMLIVTQIKFEVNTLALAKSLGQMTIYVCKKYYGKFL